MNILKQNTFKRRHTNIEKHKSINKTQLHTHHTHRYIDTEKQTYIHRNKHTIKHTIKNTHKQTKSNKTEE